MDQKTIDKFRQALTEHKDTLSEWLHLDDTKRSINLGDASDNDVKDFIIEIQETLQQIEHGNFGQCEVCHEDVETERLELDYTSCICLSHYSEQQIRALENDLELTAKVQRNLLPCSVPTVAGLDIAVQAKPARIVGGDYYDFFQFRNGNQGIVVADVMGKGLPASMLMSNLQGSLRILGSQHNTPQTVVARLNELFCRNLKLIRFISLFLLGINVEKGKLQFSNAGHHPPLKWNAISKSVDWLMPTGPAIGLSCEAAYKMDSISMNKGDLLLLYTDGLTEARNSEGEEYGEQKIVEYIKNNYELPVADLASGLTQDAEKFAGKFDDDLTMLIVKKV